MLVDIGLNLTSKQFDSDRADVVQRGLDAGVTQMIITGTTIEDSQTASRLAAASPGCLYATAGIHPHYASTYDAASLEALYQILDNPAVVAVGECGLDFNRDFSPRDAQVRCFRSQIELSIETRKPLFLHQRDAHETFIESLTPFIDKLPGGVVHCFTDTASALKEYLDLGFYIGVTGWLCDERRGQGLRECDGDSMIDYCLRRTRPTSSRDLKPRRKAAVTSPIICTSPVGWPAFWVSTSTRSPGRQQRMQPDCSVWLFRPSPAVRGTPWFSNESGRGRRLDNSKHQSGTNRSRKYKIA